MAKGNICLKKIGLVLLFVVTIMIMGSLFTTVRTNAIGSESFEAAPLQVYAIQNLDELTEE